MKCKCSVWVKWQVYHISFVSVRSNRFKSLILPPCDSSKIFLKFIPGRVLNSFDSQLCLFSLLESYWKAVVSNCWWSILCRVLPSHSIHNINMPVMDVFTLDPNACWHLLTFPDFGHNCSWWIRWRRMGHSLINTESLGYIMSIPNIDNIFRKGNKQNEKKTLKKTCKKTSK